LWRLHLGLGGDSLRDAAATCRFRLKSHHSSAHGECLMHCHPSLRSDAVSQSHRFVCGAEDLLFAITTNNRSPRPQQQPVVIFRFCERSKR
jgi:hypothetical protein